MQHDIKGEEKRIDSFELWHFRHVRRCLSWNPGTRKARSKLQSLDESPGPWTNALQWLSFIAKTAKECLNSLNSLNSLNRNKKHQKTKWFQQFQLSVAGVHRWLFGTLLAEKPKVPHIKPERIRLNSISSHGLQACLAGESKRNSDVNLCLLHQSGLKRSWLPSETHRKVYTSVSPRQSPHNGQQSCGVHTCFYTYLLNFIGEVSHTIFVVTSEGNALAIISA
jgi:hypothetical protein